MRLPNLLTVPGDPLAGYLLAAGAGAVWSQSLLLVLSISLLLYMAGLIMNDLADVRIDAQERPDRPLPSGAVDETFARLAMITFMALALLLARHVGWTMVVLALALLVCLSFYNLFLKSTVLGSLFMGLCRGLSLWMGASLVPVRPTLVVLAAGGLTLYILAVTVVARGEMTGRRIGARALLPLIAVLALIATLFPQLTVHGFAWMWLVAMGGLLVLVTGVAARQLWDAGPRSAPPVIGLLLSAVLVLQTAFCLASHAGSISLLAALVLLLLWPLNRLLSQLYSAS